MKEISNLEKIGASTLVTAIILVVIVIAAIITVSLMLGTVQFGGVTADVKARIYAPEQNIGVLNEEGLFSINVRNYEILLQ